MLFRSHGATEYQVALAWVMRRPDVMAIPKAGRAEHVRQNRKAADIVLEDEDLRAIDAAFKPPEIEYRVSLAYNINYVTVPERRVLFVEPSKGTKRLDHFLGVQEAFIDYHIRNTSDRYDFDSVRVGLEDAIQTRSQLVEAFVVHNDDGRPDEGSLVDSRGAIHVQDSVIVEKSY